MKFGFILSIVVCLPLLTVSASCAAYTGAPLAGISTFHHTGQGYLGVDFENLTSQQRKKWDLPAKVGVAIAAVDHDAPAGKAGLRANDVILKMNGKRAQHAEDLSDALHKMDPGQTVVLDILRDGHPQQVSAVLADRKTVEQQAWSQHYTVPDPKAAPATSTSFLGAASSEIGKTFSSNGGLMSYIPGTLPYTGVTFDVMSDQLAKYFGLTNTTGLLVKSVDANSPGAHAGVQAGDVICKANDAPMTSRSRWSHVLRDNRHEAIKLQILRNRQRQNLLLTLAASKS